MIETEHDPENDGGDGGDTRETPNVSNNDAGAKLEKEVILFIAEKNLSKNIASFTYILNKFPKLNDMLDVRKYLIKLIKRVKDMRKHGRPMARGRRKCHILSFYDLTH